MFQCKNPFILARNEHITVKEFYLCPRINRVEKNMLKKVKISVLMTVFNTNLAYTKRAIDSVLNQDFQDFCGYSSIAGLQHVSGKSSSWIYKPIWFIIILIAFTLSGIMVWSSIHGKPYERLYLLQEWIKNTIVPK